MKKGILFFIGMFVFAFNTKAQDGFEGYLLAGDNDRTQLIEAYINPAMKGLINGTNSGWYHTAKVHKTLGFDVTIFANGSTAPSEDQLFSLSGLTSINQPTGNLNGVATVAGSENTRQSATVNYTQNGILYSTTFNTPGGIDEDLPLGVFPSAGVQVNVGLPASFEGSVRYIPTVDFDGVEAGLFGIGIKKEITSWFGPLDKLPLHVALMATYTNVTADYEIESGGNISTNNGLAAFKLNSYSFHAIGSLNFPIINVYGGVGYGTGNSSLTMSGDYTLNYGLQTRTISDPIDSDFDASSFRTTAGIRLSLGFFKFFADYTLQEYNTVNAGVAFSFR
ncbi:hypothetical protein LPB03_15105 [Polaribacter vadi]|uniref:Uncharacterized protein n=1 Tax=Polaribacter vadi TaxID=1774273 RepID=A0A1B8TR49_9FLAO|nr:DUF6588 family protein [Polaribacter vadi]AOW18701.1 hypothetical protein LPB03_15105 [Polaribacter vadi]OBY61938.1 hypothetical protein LPB3_14205 [Polaribacter vadi]